MTIDANTTSGTAPAPAGTRPQDDELMRFHGNAYRDAAADLWRGLGLWRLWRVLAWHVLQMRYRRSLLGLAWVVLSFSLFVGVKIFVFGALTGRPLEFYAAYLAIGFLIFRLLSGFITQGLTVFIGAQQWIKSEPLPFSVHVYKLVTSNFIVFAYAMLPTVVICAYFGLWSPLALISLPFVLVIFAVNGVAVAILMGTIASRFRDFQHLIVSFTQLLYFMTPILWVAPETGLRATAATLNPLTHYIALLRDPVLSGSVPWESWQIVCACTVVLCLCAFVVFAKARKSIVYWI